MRWFVTFSLYQLALQIHGQVTDDYSLVRVEIKPVCARCRKANVECAYGSNIRWPMPGAKPGNNRARKSKAPNPRRPPSVEIPSFCVNSLAQTGSAETYDVPESIAGQIQDEDAPTRQHELEQVTKFGRHWNQTWDSDPQANVFFEAIPMPIGCAFPHPEMKHDDKILFSFCEYS